MKTDEFITLSEIWSLLATLFLIPVAYKWERKQKLERLRAYRKKHPKRFVRKH